MLPWNAKSPRNKSSSEFDLGVKWSLDWFQIEIIIQQFVLTMAIMVFYLGRFKLFAPSHYCKMGDNTNDLSYLSSQN